MFDKKQATNWKERNLKMTRREIRSNEVSDKAYNIYINSNMVVWQDGLHYYISDTVSSQRVYIGNLKALTEYLESFVEEE